MKDTPSKVTLKEVYKLISEFREEVRASYVTKPEFLPVKSIVYGMVGLSMAAIFTAILAKIVKAFL